VEPRKLPGKGKGKRIDHHMRRRSGELQLRSRRKPKEFGGLCPEECHLNLGKETGEGVRKVSARPRGGSKGQVVTTCVEKKQRYPGHTQSSASQA